MAASRDLAARDLGNRPELCEDDMPHHWATPSLFYASMPQAGQSTQAGSSQSMQSVISRCADATVLPIYSFLAFSGSTGLR